MTEPLATASLSGIPRSGLLALPSPRGAYTITLNRIAGSLNVELTATGASGTMTTTLDWFAPHLDHDLNAIAGFFHACPLVLDGYHWTVRVNERATLLELFDAAQPYRGALLAVDERGQVIA